MKRDLGTIIAELPYHPGGFSLRVGQRQTLRLFKNPLLRVGMDCHDRHCSTPFTDAVERDGRLADVFEG